MVHSLVDSQVQHLASSMHGFVGADIAALCNEAALVCLRRHINLKKTSISSSGTEDEVSVSPSSTCVDASSKAVESFQFDTEYQHKIDSSFPTAQCERYQCFTQALNYFFPNKTFLLNDLPEEVYLSSDMVQLHM
ncbi:hypothetical protein Scep_011002 [Stephania cephalantha]|uniref:AAA ATPase AAA+ lid domain-containing protein n=1 Tax=Stephania cephalantha TaxID=152367 RepID=A0AAP0JW79_9MAGN